jgi:autotransporter strand-loop-strand O-heptosyltransferase
MINVSYISRLPLKGDSPSVIVNENADKNYFVYFIDSNTSKIISYKKFKSNEKVFGGRQWFTDWEIKVYDENKNLIHTDILNLNSKTVFIKLDAKALGDTLAWIPYVEEFRLNHNCNVICSTFFNHIVKDVYTNIMFVAPNTYIDNIYAQYYVGASDDGNEAYTPLKSGSFPLQKTASDILGLAHKEVRPTLEKLVENSRRRVDGRYVCISEFGSSQSKMWKEGTNGWQQIVDYLNSKGYKVMVISKEKTALTNVIDLSGNYKLYDRMVDLYHSEFFIGISSGLSWLSWSLNKHVVMISDTTPIDHEFVYNCTRISANNLKNVDYNIENYTSIDTVINSLRVLFNE